MHHSNARRLSCSSLYKRHDSKIDSKGMSVTHDMTCLIISFGIKSFKIRAEFFVLYFSTNTLTVQCWNMNLSST
ncbi:hypothetical protein SFRURICE_014386 [Spodoptera frugiperda]|nr:hypothetical protein SFRURICE_014386 [Spodoptera frugiperda]